MMKISLATNFDNNLIEQIKEYPIYELYGKLKEDSIGGGRPNNTLSEVSKQILESHVKKCNESGIKFNYLLNGSCLSNNEQSEIWQSELRVFLDYLKEIGVTALTVTNPFILQLVKKYYTNFTVRVSTFACVDTLRKAKYWESLGADFICVDFCRINRDFKTLKIMVDNLKDAKIEILMTNSCLKECPIMGIHTSGLSHASNKFEDGTQYQDWCLHSCQKMQLENLDEYIKSPWVRPEDVIYYENIGIEHFKITERGFPTEELVRRVKSYTERSFEGNLLDLIQGHGWTNTQEEQTPSKDFNLTKNETIEELKKIRGLGCERKYPRHINIDNKKLDGFIKFFVDGNCKNNCHECNYCTNYAEKVITLYNTISSLKNCLYYILSFIIIHSDTVDCSDSPYSLDYS
ncbi:MAG: U32 family peptidase, partial [Bacilli bacterium]